MKEIICPHCKKGFNIDDTENTGDDIYLTALQAISADSRVSISTLQKKLYIGYGRAYKLVEKMEKEGVISKADGTGPRKVNKSKIAARIIDLSNSNTKNDVDLLEEFNQIYSEDEALKRPGYEPLNDFTDIKQLIARRGLHKTELKAEDLAEIEKNFHDLMRYRCRNAEDCLLWLKDNKKNLPHITNKLLNELEPQWFSVEGMYGGFAYGLFEQKGKPILITDSWIRIVGGSGQQHQITPDKVTLVARGFA